MTEGIREVLDKRQQQYTVNKNSKKNSIQYTVLEVRRFVESLNPRVYRNEQFLPFYCKAAKKLGFAKLTELEKVAVGPGVTNPEKMFTWLIREEYKARGIS